MAVELFDDLQSHDSITLRHLRSHCVGYQVAGVGDQHPTLLRRDSFGIAHGVIVVSRNATDFGTECSHRHHFRFGGVLMDEYDTAASVTPRTIGDRLAMIPVRCATQRR